MSDDAVEYKDLGLDSLIKALSARTGKLPSARVGVLGGGDARSAKGKGSKSNATVGAAHEFGTTKLPMRSFLRVPVIENLQSFLDASKFFTPAALKEVIRTSNITPWMEKIGIVGQSVVLTAFDTGGFGKWPASNMAHKEVKQTLVETRQLRKSITSDVK